MILVVMACAATCVRTSLLTLALTGSLRRSGPVEAPVEAPPAAPRPREEDRVRPAINPAGERIWVDEDDIEWHEIVSWTWPTDIQLADVQQQVSSPEHRTA